MAAEKAEPLAVPLVSFSEEVRVLVVRDFREHFGETALSKQGHFVEKEMSQVIHGYAHFLRYPSGNASLKGHRSGVLCAAMSRDGRRLFTGSRDRTIVHWSLLHNRLLQQWTAHDEAVISIDCCFRSLVSGSANRTLKIWKFDERGEVSLLRSLNGFGKVSRIRLNPSGELVAVSSQGASSFDLISVSKGRSLGRFYADGPGITHLSFVSDSCLISGSKRNPVLRVWDLSMKKGHPSISVESTLKSFRQVSLNCNASLVLCASEHSLSVISWPNMKPVRSSKMHTSKVWWHSSQPELLAMHCLLGRGRSRFSVEQTELRLVHVFNGQCIFAFNTNRTRPRQVCFTGDGSKMILLVSANEEVRVQDVSELMSAFQSREESYQKSCNL